MRRFDIGLRLRVPFALLIGVATTYVTALACSSTDDTSEFSPNDTGAAQGGSAAGPSGAGGEGGVVLDVDGGTQSLAITPKNPTLKVELPPSGQTIQFACIDGVTGNPVGDAKWSISSLALGTLSTTGLFTPSGTMTGDATVKCESGTKKAQTKLTVLIHALDNTGGLSQEQMDTLRGPPGQSDASWQFIYPYDHTVFPRGILAPEIHLTSGGMQSNAYYVHIATPTYEYEGFFNNQPFNTQLAMSQAAWEALSNAAGGTNVQVYVSKLFNGQKVGPIFRTWVMAAGKLHGTIYYNTYDSALAMQNGAIMRIKGSSPTPEVLAGNCTVCHSISSDGSTAAAANHSGPGGTFDLTGGQINPPLVWTDPERAAFAALYPKNGEVLVTNGAPGSSWPPNTPGTSAAWLSDLRTKNGTVIPNSGIESYYAQSPVFSHDGTMLAFTDRAAVQQGASWPSVLALMAYDSAAQKFSNYQVLATPSMGRHYSWPAFTPDGKYVIFQDGTGEDLATWNWFGPQGGNTGRIFAVDVQTKQVTYLTNLNGDGYVPQGARDLNKNYEPTIAPIASGGYFWVMFTSRRTYGNKLAETPDLTKRLWVAAFSLNAQPGTDPSHPPFYIGGQELTSGNSRGFWALDPCKQDGEGCESGDECCNGFCNPTGDPPTFKCGPPDGSCSDEFEACERSADCCDPQLECIGGKCTQLPPE
jgi:hypothetical protein